MEELKKKIEEATPTIEKRIDEYIENFNNNFKAVLNIERGKYSMLVNMFEFVFNEYRSSKIYKIPLDALTEIEEEIEKTFTAEDKLLFEKWKFVENMYYSHLLEDFFINGYCMAKQIDKERNEFLTKKNN